MRVDRRIRMKKVIATVVLFASIAGASVSMGAAPAGASAYGCSGFRTVNSPWGSGAVNSYCVDLQGTGTYVRTVTGTFTANVGTVCNYNITAEFFDSQGRWYMTRQTPVTYGCVWGTKFAGRITLNQDVRRGSMCSTLKQNGSRITSVCHSIY
jgi:hypothetical protein